MQNSITRIFAMLLLLLTAGIASANQPRAATVYDRIDTQKIPALLYDINVTATIGYDAAGSPMYSFLLSGYHVQMYTYDCDAIGCAGLQIRAGFSMEKPPTLNQINQWNLNSAWSRAYLDSYTDPVLESNLALYGGVSPEAIKSWIQRFTEFLPHFSRHIEF